ncbi:sugar phosphorylase [Roseibacillus persicicus]|uniref:sugar phosphorylase n=1 Tax=Roseibacillus persicicus TaxID=454148 RepID=UPI00398B5C52
MKLIRRTTFSRMKLRLARLYGPEMAEELADRLYMLIGRYGVQPRDGYEMGADAINWTEQDVVLITYGDMIRRKGEKPLATLKNFCDRRLRDAINGVHILPFSPSSSDGGFSVIDYREVEPALGGWNEVQRIGRDYKLMVDLVLNHCSRESEWFQNYVRGIAPYDRYFIEEEPGQEWLKDVTRPRPHDLLSPTETPEGLKHIWTTFSADQVDVNWESPDVLFDFLDILLDYVARGAKIVRLDAVAFLWKKKGTNCIHLPETHEVIKLFRDVLRTVAPHVILLTETNVPHEENISYFGEGDEAQMVYQFALPPLLLHALLKGDSQYLQKWASGLGDLPEGCSYFNFTASHDGVGVRPLSGLIPESERDWMIERVKERDGLVSYRAMPDGSQSPYEMNVTYRSALEVIGNPELGARRFICSQAVMLAMAGIPGIYFHSIVGEHNWTEGPQREGGERRDINRRRLSWREVEELLDDPEGESGWIANVYASMLRVRRSCSAFHPDAGQDIIPTAGNLFAILRTSLDSERKVLCVFNFAEAEEPLDQAWVTEILGHEPTRNLLRRKRKLDSTDWNLGGYECVWFE